jgi:glutathione S-transferase
MMAPAKDEAEEGGGAMEDRGVMRLLNDATSPFGRKVAVAALERGVSFEEEFVDLSNPERLARWNPLWQIPVLVSAAGEAIYDSATILLYLDTLHHDAPLFPEKDRFGVMTRVALCDGLMEAVLLRRMEQTRAEREQSPAFVARLEARVGRALAELEVVLGRKRAGEGPMQADDIAAACALGYVDFRFGTDWRAHCPRAAAWLAACADRPSLRETAPTRTRPVASGRA